MSSIQPFSPAELWEAFQGSTRATSKHLLIIYSLAVGLKARVIVDLGIGSTTRALRAAASRTGGVVMSVDCDVERFSPLLSQQDEHWRLYLGPSKAFLRSLVHPIDLVVHDAAHDYFQVKLDLELILPRMKKFGLICIHDTQQADLRLDMLAAIRDATKTHEVSITNLPFKAGLALIRVEEAMHAAITPTGTPFRDGRFDTILTSFPRPANNPGLKASDASWKRWVRWRLRKVIKGY
jgi:hypothetical protein